MESKKLELAYTSYASFDELPAFWQELIKQAEDALPRAYAPYSKFHVGAAVKLSNGQTITGTNQENAAYPSGLCAERTAILYALSQYPEAKIEGLAVITSAKNKLCAPCGGCRQVMMDTELNRTGPYPIIFPGENGSWLLFQSVKDIFPFSFNL
jgi:cytidine deaminase